MGPAFSHSSYPPPRATLFPALSLTQRQHLVNGEGHRETVLPTLPFSLPFAPPFPLVCKGRRGTFKGLDLALPIPPKTKSSVCLFIEMLLFLTP